MKRWKLARLSLDGRLDLVKKILSTMPIFQMIAIHMPAWLEKVIDKVRRGFLWESKEEATGGKYLVNWKMVCRPTKFGGLEIINQAAQSIVLRARWLWQAWTKKTRGNWVCQVEWGCEEWYSGG